MTKLALVVPSLANNALGRAYCFGLLCDLLGLDWQVVSLVDDGPIWGPLADDPIAARCVGIDPHGGGAEDARHDLLAGVDLIVSIKPLPETLGILHTMGAHRRGLIVDIDDPDVEARTIWKPWPQRARSMLRPRYWRLLSCARLARSCITTASNPVLQALYGAELIPHVREYVDGADRVDRSTAPNVAFVGTAREHKGLDILRAAVRALAGDGFTLTVTGDAPIDACAHETWLGETSMAQGRQLVRRCDIVAVPSLDQPMARGQFPVKVIDAMMAGRPVVASDVGPIGWALDGGGVLVPPGAVGDLVDALTVLADPSVRRVLGAAGHAEARRRFSVEAVAPAFEKVVARALLA